ncbi:hypothetical protein EC991_000753 [Linnemannia zychae]|nr:hypothetical protein EC991_000753 [Linnemannia zychae]
MDLPFETNAHLVQSLKLQCDIEKFREFLQAFPDISLPQLTSTEILGHCATDDQAFINFIQHGSYTGWKELAITLHHSTIRKPAFGTRLFEAVAGNAALSIEVLRFDWNGRFESKDIDMILCSAPNLKELWITSNRPTRRTSMLYAPEIVDSEWICNDLKVFSCRIGGIPRPDIIRQICGSPPSVFTLNELHQKSATLQSQVYSKLARFKKLQVLRLGWSLDDGDQNSLAQDREFYRQYGCLAMTVDSGLDIMKDLKDLRVVELQDMEVYVDGDREKTWFAENWPHAVISTTGYEDNET